MQTKYKLTEEWNDTSCYSFIPQKYVESAMLIWSENGQKIIWKEDNEEYYVSLPREDYYFSLHEETDSCHEGEILYNPDIKSENFLSAYNGQQKHIYYFLINRDKIQIEKTSNNVLERFIIIDDDNLEDKKNEIRKSYITGDSTYNFLIFEKL